MSDGVGSELIELSKYRQVIVFTHRLSFLGILIGKSKEIHEICIREEPWGAGEPSDFLITEKKPSNALNRLKDEQLACAKKTLNSHGKIAYAEKAKAICRDFRILIERIVELELLSNVVQRHRPDIKTKGVLSCNTYISAIASSHFSQVTAFFIARIY